MCYGVDDVVDTSNYEDDFKKDSCKTTFKVKNIESDAVEILKDLKLDKSSIEIPTERYMHTACNQQASASYWQTCADIDTIYNRQYN